MSNRDDLALLDAWRSGDQTAGNELFGRYFEPMFRFFRSKLERDVEDLVQQTFLACVRNTEAFRGEASFRTYLFKIAKSKLYDRLRQSMRSGIEMSLCTMEDLRTSPSTFAVRNEELLGLHQALDRLPIELSIAVELFYLEDQSARDVAYILDIPEGTVRSRIRRALETLRADIAARSDSPEARQKTLDGLAKLLASKPALEGA